MQPLQALKSFDAANHSVEEMVFLLATATSMEQGYEKFGEAPEWLLEQKAALEKAIEAAQRDDLERQLKEVQAKREALKSAEDKRQDLADKEKRLLAKLHKTPAPAG